MKKLKTIKQAVALLLCAALLCVPLLGMAPAVLAEGEPPAPTCFCDVKCTATTPNVDCPVCAAHIEDCTGKEPEPAPTCSCTAKCTEAAKNEACPVCKADIAKCTGKAPEPAPVCSCTVKCAAGTVKLDCPVCKLTLADCKGKAAEPTPAPAPSYGISILAPSGWHTRTASVEIRVTDENGTGWKTVEAKIERGGSWIDLTDDLTDRNRATLEISENCTIYITVTDKSGKAHTKSRYIECFDRTAPTIKAGIDGKLLRVEASDDLSGVDAIYIDGDRYDDLTNGTLDVRLRDLDDDYKQISVQAVDYAGNKSKTVQLNNPNYTDPDSKKDDTTKPTTPPATTPTTTTPTVTPPVTTTPPATTPPSGTANSTGKPSGGTSTGTTGTTGKTDSAGTSSQPVENKPLTPDGQATVVDNVTDEDGKEFYTIVTPAENTFYLVIDKQRDNKNVYFLNAVTESDLLALAEKEDEAGSTPATTEPLPQKCDCTKQCEAGAVNVKCPACKLDLTDCIGAKPEAPAADGEPEQPATAKNNTGMIVIVLLLVLGAGGAGYYFKVVKPKKDLDDADDFEDIEFEDAPADGEADELSESEDYAEQDEAPGDEEETEGEE